MFGRGPDGPVLGIDPGVARCGYGAVRRGPGGPEAIAYGVLRTTSDRSLPERLAGLEQELEGLVAEIRPEALAVERVLFQTNAHTAMAVGQASGLALAIAARRAVPVTYYSPNEVKLAVAGHGAAVKEQVQEMVTRLLRLGETPRPADAADALALALTHLWGARLRDLVPEGPPASASGARPGLARAVEAALAREADAAAPRGRRA
jgi:crossover junction endodeoxyribonuclease RuvC